MARFNHSKLKNIGVFTSGGDAPGMNAAIRAIVRTGIYHGFRITGIHHGYQGLLDFEFENLELKSVANIIQRGGTILKTARCEAFFKKSGRNKAATSFQKAGLDGLVAIGGDGTFRGAHAIWNESRIPIVGVPGTIDNDVNGTHLTIGFDTAVNNAVDAIDKIRDTAASHDRLFIVEVMGRNSGHLALAVGLACGAEAIFAPESPMTVSKACQNIQRGLKRGKSSSIMICAEGDTPGRVHQIARKIKEESGFDAKICILGHIQRGGSPTAVDRNLASQMGAKAVELLMSGQCDVMTGLSKDEICAVPLAKTSRGKKIDTNQLSLTQILSI